MGPERAAIRSAVAWAAAAIVLALLAPAGLAAQARGFGKNKIQYRQFTWRIYHSPHFDIYYYEAEEPLLEKVASFAESAYDRLSREFDHQIDEPVPLIFYAPPSAFEQNNIIFNFIPEGVGAFASPVRNRMVLPVDLPEGELFQLLSHELTHIFQYEILFQGRLGKGLTSSPPQWFMEGMASYMAKDEGTSEQMFLRDAVVNDSVPSILERGVRGYMAYRFGHAAFDFVEERWGKEGFRDFLYEYRNTLGSRPERAIERALRIEPEDFDSDFRRWLRKRYLPELVATGEPSDFGRPFRLEEGVEAQNISPTASPSGDLVAAFSTLRGEVDVVLFDTRKRRYLSNLTKGYSTSYQYLVGQFVTVGPRTGRDLAFSPDGNTLAVFAKRERGRSLVLFDVLKRRIARMVDMDVEQQHGPAWSSDGKRLAFSANREGRFDVFEFDLESGELKNLTNDLAYDGSPAYSPDGSSLVYSSVVAGTHAKLFRMELADPTRRVQLTDGDSEEKDAIFSADGKRLYFTSNRSSADNIWSLDLETGTLRQWTNAVTGCFMPTLLRSPEDGERLVYTGFWKGRFELFVSDLEQPVSEPLAGLVPPPPAAVEAAEPRPEFEPDIQVTLDEANDEPYRARRLFLEDADAVVGVTDDQTVLGQGFLSFSDYLGNKRIIAYFSSVESFQNFDLAYIDLSRRWQWSVRLFDDADYFVGQDTISGRLERIAARYRETGLIASIIYPWNVYHRVEVGAGYIRRNFLYQDLEFDELSGNSFPVLRERKDDFPLVQAALVGDTALFAPWGAIGGRRWRLRGSYAPDLDESGTLTANVDLDARQYIEVTQRSNLAFRLFAGASFGNFPAPYYFGGLDTVRGFPFRSLVGDRAFFFNFEYRFPLIDTLAFPGFGFRGIRGRLFLDVAGAWRSYLDQDFNFWNSDESRLEDAVSTYGWGFTVNFVGWDMHWDFSRRWDFKEDLESGFATDFWIGVRF